jgi:outer membrane receptor for ferrienterochelin and colicins
MELGLAIQNLFNQNQKQHDRGVFRDAGYMYGPGKPRTITFSIKIGNALH